VGALTGWRYCPRCATELRVEPNHVACDACGFVHYAPYAPAVTAFVRGEDGRILLARRAFEPDAGKWDALGGFLEEGEEPIAGLERELREETSLECEVGDFVGAFVDTYGDDTDARAVLNLVFEVRIARGEPTPADDVSELRWFAQGDLPTDDELAFRWLAPALRAWATNWP
jgi:ADP-ribose pyrophosphatase YjhB (NUDIX family)